MRKVVNFIGQRLIQIVLLIVIVVCLPLFYIMLISLAVILPPVLVCWKLFGDEDLSDDDLSLPAQLFLACTVLPLALVAFAAPLRSLLMMVSSFYPPALLTMNEGHSFIYNSFIPVFGELFPFWLDFYWGIYAALLFLILAIFDSFHRSNLIRQMEILPTSKVHAAAIGLVELAGTAVPIENGSKVIMRSWWESTDDGMHHQTSVNPFYLDDGTSRILIDPLDSNVRSMDDIFNVKLHHVFLKEVEESKPFRESRLTAGDEVYVIGNLQIIREADGETEKDKVIVKPLGSSLFHPNFYDMFFLTNTSERELQNSLRKSMTRGWRDVLIFMTITDWLSIYAWCNIAQLKQMDLDAAPEIFRMITGPTTLERRFTAYRQGENTTQQWLAQLRTGEGDGDEIMKALKKQELLWLGIPILLEIYRQIDHPNFGVANYWLAKTERLPGGHWGNIYYEDEKISERHTQVSRVLLTLDESRLIASFRAHFSDPLSSSPLHIKGRYVVFEFTNSETGVVKELAVWSQAGWNRVDDYELFEYFLPGEYSLSVFARRNYRGGRKDHGSNAYKPRRTRL